MMQTLVEAHRRYRDAAWEFGLEAEKQGPFV